MATPQTHNEEEDVREKVGGWQPSNNKHTAKEHNMSFWSRGWHDLNLQAHQ